MKKHYELFREGEHAGTFDLFEDADREAKSCSRPWQIFACEGHAARVIAQGDGAWKCTHHVLIPITRAALYDRPVTIGFSRFAVYVTPEGLCFTEGAWNRSDVPDFRNTGAGVARGHGGPVLVGAQIIAKDN